jgi:hypothetical protein
VLWRGPGITTSMPGRPNAMSDSSKGPTIKEALAMFLAEQQARLAPSTYRNYEEIIELLIIYLDGYGYSKYPLVSSFFRKAYGDGSLSLLWADPVLCPSVPCGAPR